MEVELANKKINVVVNYKRIKNVYMRFDEEFKAPKEKNKVWKANNSKAIQALEIIKRAMQEEIAEKIDYPVCAIKYNSSSIQKRNELQIDKYKV